MHVLINPKHFDKNYFDRLIRDLPEVSFTDDLNDDRIDAMITWPSAVKKEVLDRYPNLKIILLPSAGYDLADLAYLKKRKIILTNARGVYDVQIAEDVLAKILYFNRDMKRYQDNMNRHLWESYDQFNELFEQTVGIIGTGSIGSRIAKIIKGFDAHVIGYHRDHSMRAYFDEMLTGKSGLITLLQRSDYVVLALPLTAESTYLIDENALKNMKKNALLINISRGKIIEENALIKALNENWIRGAALDVTVHEPLPVDHPLWEAKNVYISPHVAGNSPMANRRVNALLKRIIQQYLMGELTENRIL